jgi:hypothetical protein
MARRLSPEVVADVVARLAAGQTKRHIARELKMARGTVDAAARSQAAAPAPEAAAEPGEAPADDEHEEDEQEDGADEEDDAHTIPAPEAEAPASAPHRRPSMADDFLNEVAPAHEAEASEGVDQGALMSRLMRPRATEPPPDAPRRRAREQVAEDMETVAAAAVAAVTPTEDPTAATARLIASLTDEANTYGPLLGGIIGEDRAAWQTTLLRMSAPELEVLLAAVRRTRSVANMANMFKRGVFMGAAGLEYVTLKAGMSTQGYATAVQSQDAELGMCLREFVGEHDMLLAAARPELRIAILLSSTLLMVDKINRDKAKALAVGHDQTAPPTVPEAPQSEPQTVPFAAPSVPSAAPTEPPAASTGPPVTRIPASLAAALWAPDPGAGRGRVSAAMVSAARDL